MGFLQDMSDTLNDASWILNEAAFGDIRNVFGSNEYMHNFYLRKIGIYNKNYDFMVNHIMRNIGNIEHTYDGYGTPIGELSNPFYNTETRVPWFYLDDYKNSTANYIDYVRTVYGTTFSVENINENDIFHISNDSARVALAALENDEEFIPNPNYTGTDTRIGLEGGYYNQETLKNSIVLNNERNSYGFGITSGLDKYIGLTIDNITDKHTYDSETNEETGRFEDYVFSPLLDIDGPVYNSNYGHYSDIGSYIGYYNSLTTKSKNYFANNLYNKDKIYYPTIRDNGNTIINGKTYLGRMGISVGHEKVTYQKIVDGLETKAVDEQQIRYVFATLDEHSNISNVDNGVYVYTENEYGSSTNVTYASYNSGARFSRYTSYGAGLTANDLLKKTNEGFKKGNYKTIIARFHTDASEADSTDTTQTAVSGKYGVSHGRNLLKVTPNDSEGYDNPYCRVWTFHHQYHRLADAIRPINYSADDLYSTYNFSAFTADHSSEGFENGRQRLERYGTLNKNNGLVNITPIENGDVNKKVDIRNCMFSIENLAWKDAFSTDASSRDSFQAGGLSPEQKGPFGGRIMWFPPYDLKFNEDVSVDWNETNFIGRGEGIYTYTNTRRTGTLSFKILVDHPSIINYWENKGKSVSNSVDDINDPEQQILRFFAGCDMLTGKPGPSPEKDVAISDEAIPSPDSQELKFFVFFPNDYSGEDDGGDWAMKYITNGLGAGKEIEWHLLPDGNCEQDYLVQDYDIPYATNKLDNDVNKIVGGYEMRPGIPISLNVDVSKSKNGFIADVRAGVLGNGVGCNDGKTSLYAQRDSNNMWYYRVDERYVNENLLKENYIDSTSFGLNSKFGQDAVAEHFNIEEKNTLFSLADVYVAFSSNKSIENGPSNVLRDNNGNPLYNQEKVTKLTSWIRQYGVKKITCEGRASAPGRNETNFILQKNRAKTVKNWLSEIAGFDSSIIEAKTGGAGGEGAAINNGDDNSITNKLWRCVEVTIELQKSVSKTVQSSLTEQLTTASPTQQVDESTTPGDLHQTNVLGTTDSVIKSYENSGIRQTFELTDLSANRYVEQKSFNDRLASIRLHNLSDNINGLALNLRSAAINGDVNVNSAYDIVSEFSNHSKYFQYNSLGYITNQNRGKSDGNIIPNPMHDNAAQYEGVGLNNNLQNKADSTVSNGESNYSTREGTNNNEEVRYDNEAKFFTLLEKEEPFLHHKISDKIKYFDPAFHSISPEGFNARLTFLQQCTRQGPTIGSSDNYTENNTANNLAFGRPPVCILRIGDFYYTKIIIDGLTINFDPLMWDLNTEGIGVMPMIADVNLRFKFIGGSSLAGHITRLQNALSFNYYANTEVYDNRSELVEYDENGNIAKFAPYNPTL